jgi:hypothetical protein
MTEERKHAILFAATILSARKLIDCIESDKPNFVKEYFVDRAINEAMFVLERIDRRWPTPEPTSTTTYHSFGERVGAWSNITEIP